MPPLRLQEPRDLILLIGAAPTLGGVREFDGWCLVSLTSTLLKRPSDR